MWGLKHPGDLGKKEDDESLSIWRMGGDLVVPVGKQYVHSSGTVLYVHLDSRSSHQIHLTCTYHKCQLILYLLD